MFLLKKPRRMCVPQPQKERRAPVRWPRAKVEGSMLTLGAGRGLASGHSNAGGDCPGNQPAANPRGEREVESWGGGCARGHRSLRRSSCQENGKTFSKVRRFNNEASLLVKENLFGDATRGNHSGSPTPLNGKRICPGTGCISACGYGMRIEASTFGTRGEAGMVGRTRQETDVGS